MFKGLSRKNQHFPNKALPMTPEILQEMLEFLDITKKIDLTFWCLFLFMFFLMARKSNMVPVSKVDFDPNKQLLRQDIKVFENMLVILIKWSKTNQFGNRLLKIPLAVIPRSQLCPVSAYKNMISLIPAADSDPAFCFLSSKGEIKPILYKQLQQKLRSLTAKTGREPDMFSSHSFRRGGCTWAFKSGVPTNLIQHHGDWLSDCYKNYLSFDFREKLSVSNSMAARIIRGDSFA